MILNDSNLFLPDEIFTGVPVDLIRDYNTLMVAITCGADIHPAEFEKLAESWLDRFHDNEDLNWCILAPTVHLVLHHGRYNLICEIVNN